VYLPCVGTNDRTQICEDIFSDIEVWCKRYKDCNTIVAGDFNVDLDSSDKVTQFILSFINSYSLLRCDNLFPNFKVPTYVNIALNQESQIDYIIGSRKCKF